MAENNENLDIQKGDDENNQTEDENLLLGENVNEKPENTTSEASESTTSTKEEETEKVSEAEATECSNDEKAAKADIEEQKEEISTDITDNVVEKTDIVEDFTGNNTNNEENPAEDPKVDDEPKEIENLDEISTAVTKENIETSEPKNIEDEKQVDEEISQGEISKDVVAPEINEELDTKQAPGEVTGENVQVSEESVKDEAPADTTEGGESSKTCIESEELSKISTESKESSKTCTDGGEASKTEENVASRPEEKSPPPKKKLSDTPEDIINLLKSLSPEKLMEIKSKVLEIADTSSSKKESSEFKKLKIDESSSGSEGKDDKSDKKEDEISQNENENSRTSGSDVICLDSDDDESSHQTASSVPDSEKENVTKADEQVAPQVTDVESKASSESLLETIKEDDDHSHLNGDKVKSKECINPECPRNKDDEYLECPSFVLSMYYIARKQNKIQWVCTTCFEEAVETYEKLCSKFLMNETWTTVKIPKRQDLVEIIDSDEEDEQQPSTSDKNKEVDMIVFNEEVENEVEEILVGLATKIDLKKQLDDETKLVKSKLDRNDKIIKDLNDELTRLERKSYKMYDEIYSFNRPKIQRRPSLSLDMELAPQLQGIPQALLNRSIAASDKTMPEISITPITRAGSIATQAQKSIPSVPQNEPDKICYAIRQRGVPMPHWMSCRIVEDLTTPEGKKFKVKFCDNLPNSLTIVSGREISHQAFSDKLEIGARVIALFPRSAAKNKPQIPFPPKRFLPGVIGEKLTSYNKHRYLVFCDYGQVRYCTPNEVREIQESSENVWDDVHPNLRQFIRDYLESKTNRSRALLNVRVNTQILTERAGNWRKTIVQEVDCSLVKVYFTAEHVSEWLYRGSKRLHAIFQQTQRTQSNSYQRRNDPGQFSYITIDEDENSNSGESSSNEIKRNIAKKSTAKPQQPQVQAAPVPAHQPIILNDNNIYLDDPPVVAKVRHFTPKAGISAKKFVKHECGPSCLPTLKNDLSSFSPLSKPLLSCWERQIVRQRNYRFVVYKAPCGRRLRNMHEVFIYLGLTKCALNVDNFDFDPIIQVLASYHVDKSLCPLHIDDIAEGKEGMKIICINAFDKQRPPPLTYSAHRIPMNGVNINTDPEFMSCCDCTDECVDKSKCACFQLTIRGAKYKNLMEEDEENISYYWKRLLSVVPTGIYECNSRCKCSSRCLNKVVQQPIRVKMQLYRTKARGWGLQTLHDIPKGTFICIYAGNLYTEKDANALCQGLDHGDEYFAELDLIENAENRKEGYESGVIHPDESEDEKQSDSDSDFDETKAQDYEDGDFVAKTKSTGQREIVTRSSRTSLRGDDDKSKKSSASSTPQRQNSNDDSSDDEMVNMIPDANNTGGISYPEGMRIPFRKLYGPKEKVYIMDAKKCGNVGRYFNHSCDPNLFVQSVFVDTHDLRFPWIAFFAHRHIKAGEELTWNYNYEVGSVPSKVLYCKCGSKNCRGRIL